MKYTVIALTILFGCSCSQPESNSSSSKPTAKKETRVEDREPTESTADGANANDTSIAATDEIPDYPNVYCENVGKLDVRENVDLEMSYFCRHGKPTPELLAMREQMFKAGKGILTVRTIKEKHYDDDRTDMILAWGYYVDIRPFEVKSRPLNEYIAKNLERDDITMLTESEAYSKANPDHGLHLWNAPMSYDLTVKATDGIDLVSARKTQYNMYQVLSGDEEMGFGLESLDDKNNPDYIRSIMINLSMNDGTGYNDGVGGALIFNMLHLEIDNRGFPDTASYAIGEIGAYLAGAMYDGLKE